jgi:hypothetical protein
LKLIVINVPRTTPTTALPTTAIADTRSVAGSPTSRM